MVDDLTKKKIGFWKWLWNQRIGIIEWFRENKESFEFWGFILGLIFLTTLAILSGPIASVVFNFPLLHAILVEIGGLICLVLCWSYFFYWCDMKEREAKWRIKH
jgi:uncharacterized membrane protein